jgi:spermidine/putrescine transport system substrate-binding protein
MNRRFRRAQDANIAGPSRRDFLTRAGLVTGGVVLAPSLLAACGSDSKSGTTTKGTTGGGGGGATDSVSISNWTSYMDAPLLAAFTKATGIKDTYTEDINDNDSYFAKVQPSLQNKQSIGRDGFVLTDWMANRMINQVKWVQKFDDAAFPNKKNLRAALKSPAFDPTRAYSAPWATGMTGIAYNTDATGGKEIKTMDEFLAIKGSKSVLSEMRDTIGLLMLANGEDAAKPTFAGASKAFAQLQKITGDGTIKGFNGNDYVTDLSAGNLAACFAWSGDVAQIAATNPKIKFLLPESGAMIWSDNFMVPYTTDKVKEASEWINFFYDPVNAAQLTNFIHYISPVDGVTEELMKLGPKAVALTKNPLVTPTEESLKSLTNFGPLESAEEQLFDKKFQQILGAG